MGAVLDQSPVLGLGLKGSGRGFGGCELRIEGIVKRA